MNTKKTLGLVATALTAFACVLPRMANAAAGVGDIRSIEVYQDSETVERSFPNPTAPLVAGEVVKFKIRLANRGLAATRLGGPANPWTLQHVGGNNPIADTNNMPQVGLWISGQRKYAEIESVQLNGKYYTDMICRYVVKAGDLAMPLKLVNPIGNGEAMELLDSDAPMSEPFYMKNVDLWNFFPLSNGGDTSANALEFFFGPTPHVQDGDSIPGSVFDYDSEVKDYNLGKAGIYIQAVDFDSVTTEDSAIWRNVAQGTVISTPAVPTIVIPGGSADSQTLYIWCEDDTKLIPAYGTETAYTFRNPQSGVTTTHLVSKITVTPGKTEIPIKFKAVGSTNDAPISVYMAATPTNVYDRAGTLQKNYTERKIKIVPAPPPSITVSVTPSEASTTTDFATSIAAINVTLSQAWTQDVAVVVTPTMKEGTDNPFTFIGLSPNMGGNDEYDKQVTKIVIPAGYTSAAEAGSMLYIYGNRSSDKTLKGIRFTPSLDSTAGNYAAASDYFIGEPVSDTLLLKGCKPEIVSPVEDFEYFNIPGNVDHDFTVTVADARGEIDHGKYTVCWDANGSGSYTSITGLSANAAGEITVTRRYVSAGQYNTKFYVVNEAGVKSDVRSVLVNVKAPRTVTATPDHGLDAYREGEHAKISFTFTEDFVEGTDAGGVGYIYIVPDDWSITNYVECAAFNNAPVLVYNGYSVGNSQADMYFKDGWEGCNLSFSVEVRSTQSRENDENIIKSWVGKKFGISVTNAIPTVKSVSMNSTPEAVNGNTFTTKAAVGVTKNFGVNVTEFSPIDLNTEVEAKRFQSVFQFWENGEVVDTQTIYGAPGLKTVPHTFMNAGLNKVTVKLRDKDMTDQDFADAPEFTVYVDTVSAPAINILSASGGTTFSEKNDLHSKLLVQLTVAPSGMALLDEITVRLEVTPNNTTETDTNKLGKATLNTYDVKFRNGQDGRDGSKYVYFTELDGTGLSENSGFHVRAYVVEETTSTADTNKTWRTYYQESNDFNFFVMNDDPRIGPGLANSATNTAAINVPFNIVWNVADVNADLKAMSVTWSYNGSATTTTEDLSSGTLQTKQIQFTGSGVFPVTLTVADKDGGSDTRTWWYKVNPAMLLEIYPRGPASGALAKFSQYYTSQPGLGEGRVWASDAAKPTSIENWMHLWSYQPANDLKPKVYGRGYKVGEVDNGSLTPGTDFAIDANGKWHATATEYAGYYAYPTHAGKDSFFYCWMVKSSEDNTTVHLNGVVAPEIQAKDLGQNSVDMPEVDEEATSYPRTQVEAIFSLERFVEDNVGDLNQDGIPDVFAANMAWSGGFLYEFCGYALEEAGDVKDLDAIAVYNPDNDFLPSKTAGGGLITFTEKGWETKGGVFTTYRELRGYHDGLNYRLDHDGLNRNVRGKWISVPTFSPAESNAIARVNEVKLPVPGSDTYDADLVAWTEMLNKDDSWIPENRCDPTTDDTDSDGFKDGYEYWFWYSAMVGVMQENGTIRRLEGRRFNLANIAVGDVITPEEIAKAFNPTVKSADAFNERDTDNDGLLDIEELALGTSPINWDTDGDGLNDFWEVMRGLNPLKTDTANGAQMNADGDYMAYWESDEDYAIVDIPGVGLFALPANGAQYVVPADEETGTPATFTDYGSTNFVAIEVFHYGNDSAICCPKNRGGNVTNHPDNLGGETYASPLQPLVVDIAAYVDDTDPDKAPITVTLDQRICLIHDQVRAELGFDPRTAWMNTQGYVSDRWNPGINTSQDCQVLYPAGQAINTRAYTAFDEYMLLKYRYEATPAMMGYDPDTGAAFQYTVARDRALWADKKQDKVFRLGTTNPNVAFEDPDYVTEAMNGKSYANTNHGADTDENGVPDGWELYVGHDPNSHGPSGSDEIDNDLDGLSLADEYMGVDSCNAYRNCESIYSKHPGNNSGWFNKFFPTDPDDPDTDGDTISDGAEGGNWRADWVYGKSAILNNHEFAFIYGEPADDGRTFCVRGGGLNPCSVDTDRDLLPDPFERQFAGLTFQNGQPTNDSLGEETLSLINRGDRVNGETPGIYITAGMDGTDPNDAFTNMSSTDGRTGTVRDYDWDHDGLQNFQEYLVQALRHLRYDDSETPLMGTWMPDGSPASRKFVRFLPMNFMDGETFYAECKANGFVATGAWQFDLTGYFARPAHEWDMISLDLTTENAVVYDPYGYRIMLPPCGIAQGMRVIANGYCCTDPRLWDTDNDGMDDFYELFHGLNPLLGSVQDGTIDYDVIAQMYGGQICHWANAWTGWPMEPWNGGEPLFDAIQFPWMMGTPEADADGDGLRNYEEALLVNYTSPQPTHTDPTPLWYTDHTALNLASYTSQYYRMDPTQETGGDFMVYPWSWSVGSGIPMEGSNSDGFMFSFEENEGYDTDGDRIADGDEKTVTSTPIADPIKFTDPDHRQALWFPGDQAAAVSYSASLHRPVGSLFDMLRQFTVECWVKPEDLTRDQVILERACYYTSSTLSNNVGQVRVNFRLGLLADGRLYGQFDTSDAVPSGQGLGSPTVVGSVPDTNVWTHIALTYDGKELKFHENGRVTSVAQTTFAPANGIVAVAQEAIPNMYNFPALEGGYTTLPCGLIIGANAVAREAIELNEESTWDSYNQFYAGYVDEVRIWDGARTLTQIKETYKQRMSFEDVKALRQEVYNAWINGATRNDLDGKEMLPCELLQHYNFQTLPGAVNATDVMWEPGGFNKNVFDNVRDMAGILPAGTFECGWWASLPIHSTVYENYRWVPWIQNTVQHLPFMDGSCADSQYWSEGFGGVCAAYEVYNNRNGQVSVADMLAPTDTKRIIFPNTANPYPYYIYMSELAYREFRLGYLGARDSSVSEFSNLWDFQMRTTFVGTSDLIPLGGAFAKRSPTLWDGQGCADAWELTSEGDPLFADLDGNGIPDWWQDYAIANLGAAEGFNWSSLVTWPDASGMQMTAREAYLRDLARGMLPGAVLADADGNKYLSVRDVDQDGLPDWWENLYNIYDETGYDDHDNDKLCNYAEFIISEYFGKYGFPRVSPILAHSFGQSATDYFLRVGKLYLGEMFTDHDFIDDKWEDRFAANIASRGAWDALNDYDDDGWSNYAEYMAGTHPGSIASLTVDGATSPQYPVPNIEAKFVYNGRKSFNAPIVIECWSQENAGDPAMTGLPDAAWKVPSFGEATEMTKIFGVNNGRTITVSLGPGSVTPGTVNIQFKDTKFQTITWRADGRTSGLIRNPEDAYWVTVVSDRANSDDSTIGELVYTDPYDNVNVLCGEINYNTGLMTLSLGKGLLQDYYYVQGEGQGEGQDGSITLDLIDLKHSYVQFTWTSQKISTGNGGTFYLSESLSSLGGDNGDDDAKVNTKYGYVREGKNMFIAWADFDGNNVWTPGEPFGIAADVDVGWASAKFEIELTDTTPQMARINLNAITSGGDGGGESAAKSDRDVGVNGYYYDNITPEMTGTNLPPASAITRVRVVRTSINGEVIVNTQPYNEVVLDREIYLGGHPMLTEADLVADGLLDLDWGTLAQAWSRTHSGSAIMSSLTNAAYRIVFGNGTVESLQLNNLGSMLFVNAFEPGREQTKATPVSPLGIVYGACPTFKWTHVALDSNGYKIKDYPAFRLRIATAADPEDDEVIFDSGNLRAPVRNSQGVYSWTAPVFAEMVTETGHIFSTTNNYYWQVSMLDAKFTEPAWSDAQKFRLETTGWMADGHRYGSLPVSVRYTGALADDVSNDPTALTNLIHVQAFTTPDFTGMPAAESFVSDIHNLTNTEDVVAESYNTLLRGLTAGKYYVCAYLDTNRNFKRDPWESWGYVCGVDGTDEEVWLPKAIEVKEDSVSTVYPAFPELFIEDMDTDGNGVPDCYEQFAEREGVISGNTYYTQVNVKLKEELSAFVEKNLHNGLYSPEEYVLFPLLQFIMNPTGMDTAAVSTMARMTGMPRTETEAGVRIESFSLEGGLVIAAETETKQYLGSTGATLQAAPPPTSVTVKWELLFSETLDGSFEPVEGVGGMVTLGGNAAKTQKVDFDFSGFKKDGAQSGFFKVRVTDVTK